METQRLRLCYPFTLINTKTTNNNNRKTLSPLWRSLTTKSHTSNFSKLEATNSNSKASFNEAAFEAERLSLDAEARQAMAVEEEESSLKDDPKAWKWIIRKRIWDLMERNNFAQNPRPVHHRIPNFVGASIAADKVCW
jgi:5-formyltetrahydrofolate cyclo-ligase